ncbi:hypothetical protein SAMN05192539_105714 [Paraburkholderia diazotrophica]|uniref:Uncharacterized protein n=1 Tax=Paraburkholderia diazotrophica TaxID=667676 RepID=A0A1H7EEP3_9BURK|nr:hypothetical protein SAMN05192539_105714 [Paraburkholderia diazotrophica]
MAWAKYGWSGRSTLHVFEQEGGWHWGITIPRDQGSGGFKLVAFSTQVYVSESDARENGEDALRRRRDDDSVVVPQAGTINFHGAGGRALRDVDDSYGICLKKED